MWKAGRAGEVYFHSPCLQRFDHHFFLEKPVPPTTIILQAEDTVIVTFSTHPPSEAGSIIIMSPVGSVAGGTIPSDQS